ncbi:MAG: periplasmic heavy metal sensor [Pedobacter sp.]
MTSTKYFGKIILLLALGFFVIPATSQANRMHKGSGYHMMNSGMMSQLTDEEQKTVMDLMQKYHGPMMELKKQLYAKRADLNAVMAQEKFDGKKARALGKEISALQSKFMDQHMEMFIEMREKGVSYYGTCMSGGTMGRGMMGPGMMMDDGMMGTGTMMDGRNTDMMNQNMMPSKQE